MNSNNIYMWLEQSWLIIAAIIGGVTLVWNFFHKTMREINEKLNEPIFTINTKLQTLITNFDLVTEALLTMQRNSLLRSCREFLSRGYASLEEKETIDKQYNSYHSLGGDSFITDMVTQVKNLPIEYTDSGE